MKEAKFYTEQRDSSGAKGEAGILQCALCPHECKIPANKSGYCGVRKNLNGKLFAESYGKVSSLALDPIEKKPISFFMPDSLILSIGSYGCNFRCEFCQNSSISVEPIAGNPISVRHITPEELAGIAAQHVKKGNIGLAYTYNEPLISYEYVYDCSRLVKERGMKNVVVTNGYIKEKPLREILPFIDAMNIDLKSFSQKFYENVHGGLEQVKDSISIAAKATHVEITTLIIPGLNDTECEIHELSAWLASVDPNIPLHITRFYPRYKMSSAYPTPLETISKLREVARKNLLRVV